MATLLLSRICQPEADRLAAIAKAAGWRPQWIPRKSASIRLADDDVALYAGTDEAPRVVAHCRLALIEPTFDLLSRIPAEFRQRDIRFMTLAEALELSERSFVKPADCMNKIFDAAVCETGKDLRCPSFAPRETPVLVSEPVSWDIEYRVIVLERRIVTFSPYIRAGRLARDENDAWPYPPEEADAMLSRARQLLADTSLEFPPAFTLDMGFIAGRGWAVVEFNPVWCSGLLGCDLSQMLPVLQRTCRQRENLTAADARWVIDRPILRRPT